MEKAGRYRWVGKEIKNDNEKHKETRFEENASRPLSAVSCTFTTYANECKKQGKSNVNVFLFYKLKNRALFSLAVSEFRDAYRNRCL